MMLFKLSLLLAVVYFEHGGQAQHAAVVMDAAVMLFVQARLEPFSSKQKNVLQYLGTGLTFLMAFGGVMLSYMRLAQAEASQRLFDKELTDTMAKYEGNMEIIRWILDVVLYVFTIPAIVAFWVKMLQKGKKKIAATEVAVSWDSFNHGDIFILEHQSRIFQWNGRESNPFERIKVKLFINKF